MSVVKDIPEEILQCVVETSVLTMFLEKDQGDYEGIYDYELWVWPELKAHGDLHVGFSPLLNEGAEKNYRESISRLEMFSLQEWLNTRKVKELREMSLAWAGSFPRRKEDMVSLIFGDDSLKHNAISLFISWKESEQQLINQRYGTRENEHIIRLFDLVIHRLNCWALLTMSSFGAQQKIIEREASDRAGAEKDFMELKGLNVESVADKLKQSFSAGLGENWTHDKAAKSAYKNLIDGVKRRKTLSVEELYQERSQQLKDVYWVEVTRCPLCVHLNGPVRLYSYKEDLCPPFHLSCTCELRWRHDWESPPADESTPMLNQKIKEWASRSVSGISILSLTALDIVEFERDRLYDLKNSQVKESLYMRATRWLFER